MSFHVDLEHAKDIKRDADGTAWAWTRVDAIASFDDPSVFAEYVEDHILELGEAVCFTGSASMIMRTNAFLARELKKVGKL